MALYFIRLCLRIIKILCSVYGGIKGLLIRTKIVVGFIIMIFRELNEKRFSMIII